LHFLLALSAIPCGDDIDGFFSFIVHDIIAVAQVFVLRTNRIKAKLIDVSAEKKVESLRR
jgi:hypothetical protein